MGKNDDDDLGRFGALRGLVIGFIIIAAAAAILGAGLIAVDLFMGRAR
jgi:hypothetical protein